jgi:GNAT superfamily N-acetyltransferase
LTDHHDPLIRPAGDGVREWLVEIMDATWRDTWAPNLPAAADQIWRERRIAGVFVDQVGAFCLVSEVGGSIRGLAHLSGDEVTSLHVDPKSKRLGIGGALMTGAEFQTRALGYARLRIETRAFNASAHGF